MTKVALITGRTSAAFAGSRTFAELSMDYTVPDDAGAPIQEEGGTGTIAGEAGEDVYEE